MRLHHFTPGVKDKYGDSDPTGQNDERGRGRTWAGTPRLEPAAAPAGWGGVQAGEQRGDGFFRGERGGGDGVVGETAVDGLAREKARLGGGGVGQDRAA